MKAHYYKDVGNPLESEAKFYLCMDAKAHLEITDHQWGEITCRVTGLCDGSCVKEMNVKEGPMEVMLKGRLAVLVEQFLALNGNQCGSCEAHVNTVMDFTNIRSPLPLQNR